MFRTRPHTRGRRFVRGRIPRSDVQYLSIYLSITAQRNHTSIKHRNVTVYSVLRMRRHCTVINELQEQLTNTEKCVCVLWGGRGLC